MGNGRARKPCFEGQSPTDQDQMGPKRDRAPYIAALELVTYGEKQSSESGKPDYDMRRLAWKLLMQLRGSREKLDRAPTQDIVKEVFRLQMQQRNVAVVAALSAPPLDLPHPHL